MPSLATPLQPGAHGPAPITVLTDPVLAGSASLLVALLLGLLAARLLRRRGLHWSWGAVLALAVLGLRPLLGELATPLTAQHSPRLFVPGAAIAGISMPEPTLLSTRAHVSRRRCGSKRSMQVR